MRNVEEYNNLIAEFMGFTYAHKSQDGCWYHLPDNPVDLMHNSAFDYHESWKSLMPVVNKIMDVKYDDTVDGTAYLRTFGMKNDEGQYMVRFNRYSLHAAEKLRDATYAAVIEFIQSHNQLPKP